MTTRSSTASGDMLQAAYQYCQKREPLGRLGLPNTLTSATDESANQARQEMGRSASVGVEVFADLRADVGEAPYWDERSKTLLFVDLTGGAVFRYDQSGLKLGAFSVGQALGSGVPLRAGA